MAKKVLRLTESDLHKIIKETVISIINESDDFISHGYKGETNYGGKEIQISDSGDAVRFRDNYGGNPSTPTDWIEIEFDEDGIAYAKTENGYEILGNYMRHQ